MSELNDLFKLLAEAKRVAKENDVAGKVLTETTVRLKESNPFSANKVKPKETITEVAPLTEVDKVEEILSTSPVAPIAPPMERQSELKLVSDKLKYLENWVSRIANAGPGSGEVNFRWLDDVIRSTMTDLNDNWVLEYDSASKKVKFTEDVGPIRTVKFNTTGPTTALVPGQLAWNAVEDCLDVRHNDNSTLQVGLEQYIQIRNSSGATLENGTVVRFSGVFVNEDYVPEAVPHIADGTIPPLYTIGVLTNSIPNNSTGRATVLGKVRDLNTTGSNVGEIWNAGDILYVSPTNPGKLTKVKPTAPAIVVAVAAVLKVGLTDGILLVRPTIFPRLHYGSFSDNTNQLATAINTPYAVKFNTTDIANGHSIASGSRIVAANSGLYNYQFSLQVVSTNSAAKEVYVWARKNGIDIPNSATRITIVGNSVYTVAAWNFVISMNANDYFELMWATTDLSVSLSAPAATAFCPTTPSAILTVTEAAL